jgi:hypothetical protein
LTLALAANLLVFGRFLLPDLTIAASAYTTTTLSHCRATGPALACAQPFTPSAHNDSGAPAWVEMADDAYLHRAHERREPSPHWNPYTGSGYPIALDGHGSGTSPTRWLLSRFPGEQSRDVLIFSRMFLYTAGVLAALSLSGAGLGVLVPAAPVAALSPYGTGVLDHVLLDVDLLSPWFLVLLLALATGRLSTRRATLLALCLGLLIGALGFQQSQVTSCVAAGVLALLAVPATHGRSLALGAAMAGGFLLMAPSWLPLVRNLDQFVTSRSALCIVEQGIGVEAFLRDLFGPGTLTITGPAATAAALLLIPFTPRPARFALAGFVLLGLWLVLGLPFAACQIPLLSGVRFGRHFAIHVQTLLIFGVGAAAQALSLAPLAMRTRFIGAVVGGVALFGAWRVAVPMGRPLLLVVVAALMAGTATLVLARQRPALAVSLPLHAGLAAALFTLALAPFPFTSRFADQFWSGTLGAVQLRPPPHQLSPTTALGAVQLLSSQQDRRHYSPAGHLYPNSSAGLGILDLLSLNALYPLGYHELNGGLFAGWEHDPIHGLVPDRFVPVPQHLVMSQEFQRVLVLNRVSLLTFAPGQARLGEVGSPYEASRCAFLTRSLEQGAESWLCPAVGGVGYFPGQVALARGRAEALAMLRGLPPAKLVDLVVLGPELDPSFEAQGLQAGTGQVLSVDRQGDDLTYQLHVERAGVFVVADTWFRGWSATVNGTLTPISRANVAFKAVRVPAGRVELRLHFSH